MSLTLSQQPGFTQIPATDFETGSPATPTDMQALNSSAQFAAVRCEQFWGYYRNGDTVQLPVSPADGYAYSRAELIYVFSWYATGGAGMACNGTQTPPTAGPNSGGGQVLSLNADVSNSTGLVSTLVAYYVTGGKQTNTNDGILKVTTIALRQR